MRKKSKKYVNSKLKPSALGKLGNWKVGDKFIDVIKKEEFEIIKIDNQANVPYTLKSKTGNMGATYNYIKRKLKEI